MTSGQTITTAIFLLAILAPPVTAATVDWDPWEAPARIAIGQPSASLHPLKSGIRFFQNFISPVDGPRCPMYPTCSSYAIQALDRHGPLLGSFFTVDRLLHETEPDSRRRPIRVGDRLRYFDPLDANDFWIVPR